jgi:hypothetical protein
VYIGTGDSCLERTTEQRRMLSVRVEYGSSLEAATAAAEGRRERRSLPATIDLIDSLAGVLAAAAGIGRDRVVAESVRAVDNVTFSFVAMIKPPTTLAEPTATPLAALISSPTVYSQLRTVHNGVTLVPGTGVVVPEVFVGDELPESTTAATGTGGDSNGSEATESTEDQGWTERDSVMLLGTLVAVAAVLAVGFEVAFISSRTRNNKASKRL